MQFASHWFCGCGLKGIVFDNNQIIKCVLGYESIAGLFLHANLTFTQKVRIVKPAQMNSSEWGLRVEEVTTS